MRTLPKEPSDADVGLPGEGVVTGAWRGVDRFLFAPADPTTLGLIRLCTGLVVVYVHLVYTIDLQRLVGPNAWIDLKAMTQMRTETPMFLPASYWNEPEQSEYARGYSVWSAWYHVTHPTWMMVVHLGIVAAMVLFAAGLWTRVTSVLTVLGALCYIQRAPTTLFGMDTMMIILLWYLMIGPSGAALSADRLLERYFGARRRKGRGRVGWADLWAEPAPRPSVSANFALRLIQIHFCIIYLASGLSKLQGGPWWNGTATWGVMANPEFNPMNVPLYDHLLLTLSRHRWVWEIAMAGGTLFTVGLEISLPYLIWSPRWRWVMVCGGVMLHSGIGLIMGLVTFSMLMLCMLLAFVPGETVRRLLGAAVAHTERLVSRQAPELGPVRAASALSAGRP